MKSIPSPRRRPRWLGVLSVAFFAVYATACSGTTNANKAMNSNASPSLVSAWKMQLRPVGTDQVQLSYRPLVSSAKKYVGADHRSDGKTMWVTLKSCLVTENCIAMSQAQPLPGATDRFTYMVVLPSKGEKVMVQGQGDVQEELPLSR